MGRGKKSNFQSMKNKDVIIRPEAESDIDDAYQWYESQRKGLGDNFLLCLEEALSRASRNPLIYSTIYKEVRRVFIRPTRGFKPPSLDG